jgi:hypothetical protein
MSVPDQLSDDTPVLVDRPGTADRTLDSSPGLLQWFNEPLFLDVVNYLPKDKAAGPDENPNDVIQLMPKEFLSLLFRILKKAWEGHHTPAVWKASTIALLHKKGDPTLLKNWRPIALANCIYKLWTAVITRLLTDDTEFQKVLHGSQEGFRRKRNTLRQLSTMMVTIQDAQLSGKTLHVMYIDFENAFGSPDHGRLLEVLEHEGYPRDALEVGKDIYPGNDMSKSPMMVSVRTAHGETQSFVPSLSDGGLFRGAIRAPCCLKYFSTPFSVGLTPERTVTRLKRPRSGSLPLRSLMT